MAFAFQHTGALKPNQLPPKDNGKLMTNHIATRANIVQKGTAPLESLNHRKKFRKKNELKTTPGIKTGVKTMFRFHASPPKVLYIRAET